MTEVGIKQYLVWQSTVSLTRRNLLAAFKKIKKKSSFTCPPPTWLGPEITKNLYSDVLKRRLLHILSTRKKR
jgi:hypothetical protein